MSKFKITDTATPSERRMSYLGEDVLDTLDKAIKLIDPNLDIGEVNYQTGLINVYMNYNVGTPDQWTLCDFLVVNVNADSVSAAFHDVYSRVYDRCR